MSDELQAAAERYEKHKAAKSTGESPYHVIEDGARFTNLKPMLDDLRTLADAYLSLAPRIAEMQHRMGVVMRAAVREEMRNPTEPAKGET